MRTEWVKQNLGILRTCSVVVPLLVSGLLYLGNGVLSGQASALVLVLIVVGIAATGDRLSGILAGHIRHSLRAERVTYAEGAPSPDQAIVQRDGSVTLQGVTLNVTSDGLPTDRLTAIPVIQGERTLGRFQVTTATRLVKPSPEQLRVAVLLADQVARRRAPAAARGVVGDVL